MIILFHSINCILQQIFDSLLSHSFFFTLSFSLTLSSYNFSSFKIHFSKKNPFKLCPVIFLSFVIYTSSAHKTVWARSRPAYIETNVSHIQHFIFVTNAYVHLNLTKKPVSFSIAVRGFFISLVTYSHVLHFFKLICYPRRWLSLT